MSRVDLKEVQETGATEPQSTVLEDFDSNHQYDVATTMIHSLSDESMVTNFVDYTPPPAIKILPPAKYKLWLMVYVVVHFASWLASEVNMIDVFRFNGWIDADGAALLQFGLIVLVMIYSTIDLVVISLTIRTKDGNVYGMEAFLKAPRAQWVYKHDNFLFQLLARMVHILEDGFSMFDAPPTQNIFTTPAPAAQQQHQHQFDSPYPSSEKILKIEHRIRHDKLEDYVKWLTKIENAIEQYNGIKVLSKSIIQKESSMMTTDDLEGGKSNSNDDALYQAIVVKFANLGALNDWMLNPRRIVLMEALKPMLAVPDIIKIQQERILPDSFTDLLIRQGGGNGGGARPSPPKKWKVWWLTVLALFLTVKWTSTFLPSYLSAWGLTESDHRVQRLVTLLPITFINSYITSPLILFFFDYWLNHHTADMKQHNTKEPWKTFDNGLQSIWTKLLLSVLFFGGCLLGALLK